ncbi:MAG: histone deacetylase [Desulfobacteraceae bacterium]|nr:MAG: histone deacetylase [Desulfobacteraceae bacterium]
MLKREILKQAIDAIAAREPEIGYALAELFGTGRIDTARDEAHDGSLFYFYFDSQLVPVEKSNYFHEGSASIEQPLLIKYGEMAAKQTLAASTGSVDFSQAHQSIRRAGLSLLVRHEVNRALKRLADPAGVAANGPRAEVRDLIDRLHRGTPAKGWPRHADDPRVLFSGAVDADRPAFFVPFIFTTESLMQLADLELPFFSPRFVLDCLRNGTAPDLFACIVDGAIAGLIYLGSQRTFFYKAMEIKYVASARYRPAGAAQKIPVHRGVGTFLIAGAWLLWKNDRPGVGEIVLDAEIPSAAFYETIGFAKRRPYVYVLDRPAGYLLNALAVMADRSRAIRPPVISALTKLIKHQVRYLGCSRPDDPRREQALHFLKLCLLSRSRPDLAKAAAMGLLKRKQHIAEAESLLQLPARYGRLRLIDPQPAALAPILIYRNAAMQSHLQGVFHLENANRIKAIDALLQEPQLSGKWTEVAARKASEEELAWVHTADHIARIKSTAGKRLHSIDLDTQTTSFSYEAACLAAGGVFNLLESICKGRSGRGFAAVRPPGHHAEPGKAMGFCLFNNAALGACYLKYLQDMPRVMIVDIDAHHGNGTQAAFFDRREVLFVSMHQFPCYPGSGNFNEIGYGPGEGYNVNVPLEKGMGDREFVQVIHRLVDPLACAYEPGLILVSCGFDLYQHDRLAGLNGTPNGYAMLTRQLCGLADKVCGGRIAFIMEGGYSVQGIRECGLRVIAELCHIPTFEQDRLDKILQSSSPFAALQKTVALHSKYWPILKG